MTNSEHTVTRRKFLRNSAVGAGIVVGTLGISRLERADAVQKAANPADDYPWTVEVNRPAQATMFLLMGRTLAEIINDDLAATLAYMRQRAEWTLSLGGVVASRLAIAISDDKSGTVGAEPNGIHTLITRLTAAHSVAAQYTSTYADWAKLPPNDPQRSALEPTLINLEPMITAPLRRTDNQRISREYGAIEQADTEHHGRATTTPRYAGRSLEELFTRPHTQVNHPGYPSPGRRAEQDHWRQMKRLGLLWCRPLVSVSAETEKETKETKSDIGTFIGNGKRCDTTSMTCVNSNNSDDYCQMVDGHCNTMGG